jgi:hypothetical protein
MQAFVDALGEPEFEHEAVDDGDAAVGRAAVSLGDLAVQVSAGEDGTIAADAGLGLALVESKLQAEVPASGRGVELLQSLTLPLVEGARTRYLPVHSKSFHEQCDAGRLPSRKGPFRREISSLFMRYPRRAQGQTLGSGLDGLADDFARLRSNGEAWAEEQAERDAWNATLADGLGKE